MLIPVAQVNANLKCVLLYIKIGCTDKDASNSKSNICILLVTSIMRQNTILYEYVKYKRRRRKLKSSVQYLIQF